MKAFVVGAAGNFGGLAIAPLIARGVEVRGMVRKAEQAGLARARGATEVVVADLRTPETIEAATRGGWHFLHSAAVYRG